MTFLQNYTVKVDYHHNIWMQLNKETTCLFNWKKLKLKETRISTYKRGGKLFTINS